LLDRNRRDARQRLAFFVVERGQVSDTMNAQAVQILLGRAKIESTVRYLGIEVDDALAIAEQVDI